MYIDIPSIPQKDFTQEELQILVHDMAKEAALDTALNASMRATRTLTRASAILFLAEKCGIHLTTETPDASKTPSSDRGARSSRLPSPGGLSSKSEKSNSTDSEYTVVSSTHSARHNPRSASRARYKKRPARSG